MSEDEEVVSGELIGPELRQEFKDDDERNVRDMGFHAMTKAERQEMARRSHAVRRAKKRAAQLAELEAFTDAHRELASQLLGAKMTLLDGLIDEMRDPVTNELDTSRLNENRMKVLLQLMKMMEERAFGSITQKSESKQTVDIRAAVVDLTKALSKPDSV